MTCSAHAPERESVMHTGVQGRVYAEELSCASPKGTAEPAAPAGGLCVIHEANYGLALMT